MSNGFKVIFLLAVSCLSMEWPTFRGNQERTGLSNEHVGVPVAGPLWKDSLGCGFVSSPSVTSNILYIGGRDSVLYAMDANSGRMVWRKRVQGGLDSSPLLFKDVLAVGCRDGMIYMLDKQTGDPLSSINAGLQLSSPALTSDGLILSGLGPPSGGVAAYQWHTAIEAWRFSIDQIVYSSPALSGNLIVVGANNGKLYCLDVAKKDTVWSFQTEGGVYLSTPVIDKGTVYFAPGNYDWNVYSFKLNDGAFLWKSFGTPVYQIAKRRVNIQNAISPVQFMELLRLSPADRQKAIVTLSKQHIGVPKIPVKSNGANSVQDSADNFFPYGDMKTSSVAVDAENVYVIQKELGYPKPRFTIFALNKSSGREAWYFSELRNSERLGYCSSPVVANNKVFFGWGEGKVYALNAKDGRKLWEDSLNGHILSSPAIANGRLYVATYGGYVYAYDLNGTPTPGNFNEGTYCYPNPAMAVSQIQYFPEKAGNVEVRIYDAAERLVGYYIMNGAAARTKGRFDWDVSRAANGVYFAIVKITYTDKSMDKKILKIAVIKGAQ
jgi:eukaryotic-like serine/threonine-protein kinase